MTILGVICCYDLFQIKSNMMFVVFLTTLVFGVFLLPMLMFNDM